MDRKVDNSINERWWARCSRRLVAALAILLAPAYAASAQEAIQLSQPGAGFARNDWQLSSDGERLIYVQQGALWSVSTRGGPAVRLSSATPDFIGAFNITLDSQKVVFGEQASGISTLFSINVAGPPGSAVPLSSGISAFVIGLRSLTDELVYLENFNAEWHRYLVPIAGPIAARTQLPIAPSDLVGFDLDQLSPDQRYLVSFTGSDVLVSVDLDQPGSPAVSLKPPASDNVSKFQILPDSNRVLMEDTSLELYSVPIGGPSSAAVELSGTLDANVVQITTDGQRVQFANSPGTYTVPTLGPSSAAVRIDSPGDESLFWVSTFDPDTTYQRTGVFGPPAELFAVPISGPPGDRIRISRPVSGTGTGVRRWAESPDGRYVVMEESTFSSAGAVGYRSVTADPLATSELIWTIQVDLQEFAFHPNSSFVGLVGDVLGQGDNDRVWIAPLSGTPHREIELLELGDIPGALAIHSLRFGPRGSLFFVANLSGAGNQIFTIPLVHLDGFERGDATGWD